LLHALAALFALYMLARYGRAALLFVAPSLLRVTGEAGAGPRTLAQVRAGEALAALGFVRVGARREAGPLGALEVRTDAWASEADGVYADVAERAVAGGPAVSFTSRFPDGAFVVTANHARIALQGPKLQLGGLPGATVEAALAAHRVAVARFASDHGAPTAPADLAIRLEVARHYGRGHGRRELRRRTAMAFANACIALLLLLGSMNVIARRVK
jgi:hypothetical protein